MADDKDKKLKELEEEIKKFKEAIKAAPAETLTAPPPPNPVGLEPAKRNAMGEALDLRRGKRVDAIIDNQKNGKGKKTQGDKIVKRLAKAKRERAASLATMLAEEKKDADTAARRSEKERQVREKHDKDKPSAWEMGFATMTGGLGGLLFGTYDRYSKASRGAEVEIEELRKQNKLTDAAMGRAVTSARTGRTAASVRDKIWSGTDEQESGETSSIFTHNIWEPYINPKDSKGNRVNILAGIDGPNGIFKVGDSYEKTFADIEKVFKKAAKHNPKSVLLARKINSRILGVMKDNEENVSFEAKEDWNKGRLMVAVNASFPNVFDEKMRESVVRNINWGVTTDIHEAMDSNIKLGAKIALFDAFAANKDRKFDKFRREWSRVKRDEKGVLVSEAALDNLLDEQVGDSAILNNLEVYEMLQADSTEAFAALETAKENGKPPKEIERLTKGLEAAKARQALAATVAGKTGMELVVNDDGSWGVRAEASEGQSLIKGFTDDKGRYRWTPDINSINKIQGATPAETKVLRVRALAEAKEIIADLIRHPAGSLISAPAGYVPEFGDIVTEEDYNKFRRGLTAADHDEYAKTFGSVIKRVLDEDNKVKITLEMVRDGGYDEATADQVNRLGDPRVFKYIEDIIEAKRKEDK